MEKQQKQVNQFRMISMAEGVSFLLLLLIAMPLKYMADIPEPVKYTGWFHGVLFIAYIFQLFYLSSELKWPLKRVFLYFIAAFLPIAPFIVEKRLKKEYC